MSSESAVTLKQAEEKIRMHWAQDPHRPIMLWGASGIGKSAMVDSMVANPTDAVVSMLKEGQKPGFYILRAHSLNPAELNGVLIDRGDHAGWLPLEVLPDPARGDPSAGYIFLDEVNTAMQSIMGELMQLVYDRRTAQYRVPDGYHVIAAGNLATDMAAINRMPSPLKRRFVNIHVEADLDEWRHWAYRNEIDPRIIGFLKWRPNLLIASPTRTEEAEACPRTWEYASGVLTSPKPVGNELLLSALTDCVGPGAAAELWGYLRVADQLPNMDDIIRGKNVPAPKGEHAPAVTYALCAGLVTKLAKPPKKLKISKEQIAENLLRWSMRELSDEYAVLLIKDCVAVDEKVITTAPAFTDWSERHEDVIL